MDKLIDLPDKLKVDTLELMAEEKGTIHNNIPVSCSVGLQWYCIGTASFKVELGLQQQYSYSAIDAVSCE